MNVNVLVYSGSDVSPASLQNTLTSLRSLLTPNYAVQNVTAQALSAHPWPASCALLVLPSLLPAAPGGSGLTVAAAKGIQNYLDRGGKLLSLGTGVRVASQKAASAFTLSTAVADMSLADAATKSAQPPAKITLEDTNSRLSFALVPSPDPAKESAHTTVQLAGDGSVDGIASVGNVELSDIQDPEGVGIKILARASSESTPIVGINARIGQGTAVLWSVHLETPLQQTQEQARRQALRKTFEDLGLRLPSSEGSSPAQARPRPQILSAAPWRAGVVKAILNALEVPSLTEPYELKDTNDTFRLYSSTDASRVFAELPHASDDPTTWNPKDIVVYDDLSAPPRELTPKFDISVYNDQLAKERKERGCPDSYPDGSWGMGEALLYGEVVTSTQTMLDKNNRLLTTLPTPLVSLASQQLTGRGRGANIWLSPPGCLQFSILLRIPLASFPASKIVFVQYLFALAVVEACRSVDVLGPDTGSRVRIKWPNDLYAITLDGEQRKIGGILVNTSFSSGKVEIVIGCGLNILNPPPITSLSQLLSSSAQAPPTMEGTLAAIMARFERMWSEFVRERGSFEPFMDLYLDRWLHSDQLVTLTTVTPARKVRIVGITPDHGLLRTMPERDGYASASAGMEFIDLQPDGNSFDLMAGLIKTKT